MDNQEFTLVLRGPIDDVIVDALFEAGCDDATIRTSGALAFADFDRESPAMLEALTSAIRQVRSVGLEVRSVEPSDFVTLSEIAERLGRTRESVRLLAEGQRGGGDFPPAVVRVEDRGRLYRWSQVAEWAELEAAEIERAVSVAVVNARLSLGLLDSERARSMEKEVADLMSA
jgi:hypothetical protein